MRVRQIRGINHARLIKRRAMRLWKENKLEYGLWKTCLEMEIENHRLKIEDEILRNKAEELSFQCDNNGFL